MERMEKRRHVFRFRPFENKASSVVLSHLQFVKEKLWTTRKVGVAVIEFGENKSTNKSFGCIFSKKMTNRTDSTEFWGACSTDIRDMLLKVLVQE